MRREWARPALGVGLPRACGSSPYAAETGRKPGIVLIFERPGDLRNMGRIQAVDAAFGLGLTVWTVGPAAP
ncbi:hypothetical protein [Desulfovibrio aminophilus]|uniref:hypothetical protein n=1 Tax=Desulfovibrio aminophilus TaxID=81425 RepID=UPI0012EC0F15|nr:hypothetical protein [Desulfovibrio aminophilus]